MADNNQLNYGWLYKLTNPHHDGTTQQGDDFMQAFVSDNPVFNQKRDTVHQCRQNEDQAWIKSQRDPAVKRLEDADKKQDAYEMAGHYVLQAHAQLPDDEPTKAAANRVAVITMVEMTIQAEAITQAVVTIPAVVAAAEPIPTIRRTTKTKPRSGN